MTSNESIAAEQRVLLPYLLDAIHELFVRYVRLPGESYGHLIALWVVHTHAVMSARTSPRLIFKSPEKASGKTRALEVLETLVPAPVNTINASVAAIFRKLKDTQVTLLFDEVDTIFNSKAANQHDELRGLLNAGWQKGKAILRVVGEGKKMRVEDFPVYAAVALAAIGDLPDTIESRAIVVPMRRRTPDEPLEPFRLRNVSVVADELRESLAWWARRYADELAEWEPSVPAGIGDRLADGLEPLLAIAEMAGEPWTSHGRAAAERIGGGHGIDEASAGVQLLGHLKTVFGSNDRISSAGLLAGLNAIDEAPWGGWNGGNGILARDLARRLRPYGISSRNIRLPDGSTPKGYLRTDFKDSWTRYLPQQGPQAPRGPQERIGVAAVAAMADVLGGNATSLNGWPDDSEVLSLVAAGLPPDEEA